jgi:hypothetical protein
MPPAGSCPCAAARTDRFSTQEVLQESQLLLCFFNRRNEKGGKEGVVRCCVVQGKEREEAREEEEPEESEQVLLDVVRGERVRLCASNDAEAASRARAAPDRRALGES